MRVLTVSDLIRRPTAEEDAARQYARAVERHFEDAEWLLRQGQADAAERIAKGAAALRAEARFEVRKGPHGEA